MDKKQTPKKRKLNTYTGKTGVKRPSDAVSGGKFIQYPTGNTPAGGAKKTKAVRKPENRYNSQRKSRKTIRQQRNRTRLATFFLVSVLLAICIFISLKVLFIVRTVESEGSERYTQEEIIAFCAIPLEENIFKIDTKTLESGLVENFTYIETADVQRRLPDKILVKITDSVPTYYGESEKDGVYTYTIYSQNFKYLTAQASAPQDLMGISADLENRYIKNTIGDIISLIKTNGYENITKITVKSASDISLEYDGRIDISIGSMLDADYKLKMAFHVITKELKAADKGVVDATQAGTAVFRPEF